jgi:Fe-S cluster biogenesis protein NfuA
VSEEELQDLLRRVVAPLIEADDGELYLVPATGLVVHLHLRGRFSGCPGNGLVTEHILRPVLCRQEPSTEVRVTSGAILPDGAQRISAAS